MKLNHIISGLALAAVVATCAPDASAVPALKRPVTITQADGSTITVVNHGDEWGHYTTTVDNHLLLNVNGLYEYGCLDNTGKVVASGIRANENRTAAERQFLSSIDSRKIIDTRFAEVTASTAARRVEYGKRFRTPMLPGSDAAEQKRVAPNLSNMLTTSFPSEGKQKAIVILVEYSDVKFTLSDPYDYFNRMLNQEGFSDNGCTGSARDYFLNASGGKFDCDFDVYGPITLPQKMSYYGGNDWYGNDQHAEQMVIQACDALNNTVDFSQYDRDGDGVIDNVFVFYAGLGEATSNNENTVWPHSSDIRYYGTYRYDGKTLGNYACTNEWITYVSPNRADAIGTFVHEFSHVMGLPDLYSTSYTSAFTPGDWSILDSGPYNNNGLCPPTYTAFERISMGWLEPTILDGPANGYLEDIFSNHAYVIPTDRSNEFFVLENRQRRSYDKYVPGHGMLIWHIDFNKTVWNNNTVNNTVSHQYVDIVEANGQSSSANDSHYTKGRQGNPFPGTSRVYEFTSETTPGLVTWAGHAVDMPITDIAENGGVITFLAMGGDVALEAPVMNPVTDVTPRAFTLNWQAVGSARSYLVTVTAGGKPVAGYENLNVGNVTTFTVNGLEPSTVYTATVKSQGVTSEYISEASTPVNVTTGALTFDYIIPTANTSSRTDTEATLSWNAVNGATSYIVDVFSLGYGGVVDDFVDFTGGLDELPSGWSTSSTNTYTSFLYCVETPSLRLDRGQYLQSPVYDYDITKVSYWNRTSSAGASNTVRVDFLIDDSWVNYDFMPVVTSSTNNVVTIDNVPEGARAVRLLFDGSGNASLGLDDVTVSHATTIERSYLAGYQNHNAGNVTALNVSGLTPSTEYFFTVRGHDGSVATMESEQTPIVRGSGVVDILGEDYVTAPARYYNLQGVEVNPANIAPGIYIVRRGTVTSKVVIR